METSKMRQVADIEAKKAVKSHEKKLHGKGFAKGGKTNAQMRKLGRNLAKVANQKVSSFKYKNGG